MDNKEGFPGLNNRNEILKAIQVRAKILVPQLCEAISCIMEVTFEDENKENLLI